MKSTTVFLSALLTAPTTALPSLPGLLQTPNPPTIHTISSSTIPDSKSNAPNESTAITGYVYNQCAFPIYITSAYCCPTCITKTTLVSSGTGSWNEIRAFNNGCSQVIKISRSGRFDGPIYQIEYNMVGSPEDWGSQGSASNISSSNASESEPTEEPVKSEKGNSESGKGEDGKPLLWYNLSAVNGDPFWEVARYLEIRGADADVCRRMYCSPGEDRGACGWPTLGKCEAKTGNDVMFYLC